MSERGFARTIQRLWRENALFSVLLELTYRCNLNCFYCYNDLDLKGEAMEWADYRRLLEDLRAMQVMNLVLSGGEPLLHPDFFAVGGAARDLGFVVRVKTNGHQWTPACARRVRDEIDPFMIDISVHGATAETHDRQTRVAGSFDRLWSNLASMADLGLRIQLNCTLTRWNEREIEGIYAKADALDLPLKVSTEVTPRDNGDRSPLQITPTVAGIRHLFDYQRARAAQRASAHESITEAAPASTPEPAAAPSEVATVPDGSEPAGKPARKHCGAGSSTVAIDPFGNVYPCVQWRQPVGNVRTESIRQIWTGSTALADVRAVNEQVGAMVRARGAEGRSLAFCPGAARLATGDPLVVHAASQRRVEAEAPARPLLPIVR